MVIEYYKLNVNLSKCSISQWLTGVHFYQSCHLHKLLQLKPEQINKMTTIFTQNDHFFQIWPFRLEKVNLLSYFCLILRSKEEKMAIQLNQKSSDMIAVNRHSVCSKPITAVMGLLHTECTVELFKKKTRRYCSKGQNTNCNN